MNVVHFVTQLLVPLLPSSTHTTAHLRSQHHKKTHQFAIKYQQRNAPNSAKRRCLLPAACWQRSNRLPYFNVLLNYGLDADFKPDENGYGLSHCLSNLAIMVKVNHNHLELP
jgi:hypothetical protein